MGSRERKTKITSNRGMIREKREVLKKLEKNPKSVVDFLKKELKLPPQSTDENLQDEWANWRVGPEGGDIYKRGPGKKNLDYIDDLLKDPEFSKQYYEKTRNYVLINRDEYRIKQSYSRKCENILRRNISNVIYQINNFSKRNLHSLNLLEYLRTDIN